MTDRSKAFDALKAAEAKIREAQRARDEASERLDRALAARGWVRVIGAFSPAQPRSTSATASPSRSTRRSRSNSRRGPRHELDNLDPAPPQATSPRSAVSSAT
jgi:hypothetical protein